MTKVHNEVILYVANRAGWQVESANRQNYKSSVSGLIFYGNQIKLGKEYLNLILGEYLFSFLLFILAEHDAVRE